MEEPLDIITEAFNKLRKSISDEDALDFESTKLEDVWTAIRQIDSAQRQRQSAQNLRRVEPLLKGIEKYAKVIEVLCNGTPFMPYVWAPIKLMIQLFKLASQHYAIFEALLIAYADIGAALPRFDRYEKTFKENREFQSVLAIVYSGILEFHQRAYKFFRRRAWQSLFLSLWKDFESRFASIIDRLKKQRDFVDREAVSIDIVESRESRLRLQRDIQQTHKHSLQLLEQNETNAAIARLQHSITWLSVDDRDQEMYYDRISTRRHDETCEWVMRQSHMKSWMRDDTNDPVLWLSGKPGAGKSVMCSYIIQVLLKAPRLDTCYYFCNGQDVENDYGQLLRTITLQLLRRNIHLASLICNEFVYRGKSCGMRELKTLLPKILEITSCTRIVIDGIDEFSKETQLLVLKDLQSFCYGDALRCKIIFSSRKEVHLVEKLSRKSQICLDDREEVKLDIQLYVKSSVGALRTSDHMLLSKIEVILVDKADGMFLWVRLVVEELRNCFSDWDLEDRANSLPRGLKAAYGRILKRIMDEHGTASHAIRVLQWMACCCRPLKIYEILDGITLRPTCPTLNCKTRIRKEVLDLCRPLIEDGPSETLDFVHFSAKEYLLREGFHGTAPFINHEDAHFSICFSCVAYLNTSYCLLSDRSTEQERAEQLVKGFHGLHPYADRFWTHHLQAYCASIHKEQKQLQRPLLDQLNELIKFQKDIYHPEEQIDPVQVGGLEILDQHPRIMSLVRRAIAFRAKLEQDHMSNSTDISAEDAVLKSCASDPTYFSKVRHYYQISVESLLDPRASEKFPRIHPSQLQSFLGTFGLSAFVCRYIHCSRATQGFDSFKQRANHEATHARNFRCAHLSCVSFSTGFATKAALNRHNQKYHTAVDSHISLAETISTSMGLPNAFKVKDNMPAAIKQFQLDVSGAVGEIALRKTQEFEGLLEQGRSFKTDTPEVEQLDKIVQQMKWNDRARDNRDQFLSLKEVSDLIKEGKRLEIPEYNEFLNYYKDQASQGRAWETKAKELINAESIHYPQLEALSIQAQAVALTVSVETLAAVNQILDKQRDAKKQIISLFERSRNEHFRERPLYSEVREIMEQLAELNTKPNGTLNLEKEQKRHEDWMRKGKKLFGRANAPLHILKSHMEYVLERNLDCFDIASDKPRIPTKPALRKSSLRFLEVFCICRRIEIGLMIECELCHEWYHSKCLRIAEGKFKDEKYTCPICDWRVKIPRDAAKPKLEDLQAWKNEIPLLPFQPDEEDILAKIIDNAQEFRNHLSPFCNPTMSTADECETQRFYLRKIEGAEILLAFETNFFRQELHKWSPVTTEPPPLLLEKPKSTRKPRPTKLQKLLAEHGVDSNP
ncbi:PLU-1-domain-containing protein [Acephala macrosclerotiorum]|nr:PLU-1-domain-containing protein [Acephala macrosclerotiorum]